jgi:hypothetical protein
MNAIATVPVKHSASSRIFIRNCDIALQHVEK